LNARWLERADNRQNKEVACQVFRPLLPCDPAFSFLGTYGATRVTAQTPSDVFRLFRRRDRNKDINPTTSVSPNFPTSGNHTDSLQLDALNASFPQILRFMLNMEAAMATIIESRGSLSKETTNQVSPPPAYSPQSRPVNHARVPAGQVPFYHNLLLQQQQAVLGRTPSATLVADEDEADAEEGQSPISLRINTSIRISSNNNLICINDTPADHANAIARAVVVALQENSSGQCGIPMIDEDGRPRPVRIEVDAGMEVRGMGNVIGNEKVVNEVLRQRSDRRRQRDDSEEEEEIERADEPAKRRRTE
jgi:hypothetical protein